LTTSGYDIFLYDIPERKLAPSIPGGELWRIGALLVCDLGATAAVPVAYGKPTRHDDAPATGEIEMNSQFKRERSSLANCR